MRPIVLLALLALISLILLRRWIGQTPRAVVVQHMRRAGIAIAIGLSVFLVASGRLLPWLAALFGVLAAGVARLRPLLRFLPLLQRLWAYRRPNTGFGNAGTGAGTSTPDRSTVEARFVRMTLDHESGEINGDVLEGEFAGKSLHQLGLKDLAQLLMECQTADEESAALVLAYLERVHGDDWQAKVNPETRRDSPAHNGELTREEAYQVLGLEPGASEQEIIAAHRRLMQKLHPDHGGSDYLAAKINQAKEILLSK